MTPVLDAVRREELRKLVEAAHVHGWRCPFCSCQTFARIDELGQHGYAPGDDVRCVSCKHEFYWPRFNETADTTLALLAYIAELETTLTNVRRRAKNARGAIESNQVVDKDVHGSMTWILETIDTALKEKT